MSDRDRPAPEHRRPDGVDDKTVEALGKLSESLEVIEDARGSLYRFHRLTGTADLALGEAVDLLREAGHDSLAGEIQSRLVGRNVHRGPVDLPDRGGVRRRLLPAVQGAGGQGARLASCRASATCTRPR